MSPMWRYSTVKGVGLKPIGEAAMNCRGTTEEMIVDKVRTRTRDT